jgi:two-component system chemotaxis response regulator CheY
MAILYLVEDNEDILRLYARLLTLNGCRVIGTAKNGVEAVQIYKSLPERPDVIIMDHRMPVKNGIEATKEILQLDPEAKIIFASADQGVKLLALSIGAARFNQKPFQIDILLGDIRALACS